MALIDVQWKPTQRQLRQFGVICLCALPLLAWLWGGSPRVIGILAGIGLALAVTGFVAPDILKPVFLGLTLITLPIGLVIGEFAMILIYFGLFLPLGMLFRLARRDSLQLKNNNPKTFWQPKQQPASKSSYFHQS